MKPVGNLKQWFKNRGSRALSLAFGAGLAVLATGCLDRPLCPKPASVVDPNNKADDCNPRTTNVIVDTLTQNSVDKIDMLFVIDNSASMADKQEVLAKALPVLVGRLVNPICIGMNGAAMPAPASIDQDCPDGSSREFQPLKDINIGVITSSLGDFGDRLRSCTPHDNIERYSDTNDGAHLLGRLPRGSAAISASADAAKDAQGNLLGFLHWSATSVPTAFSDTFRSLVSSAAEFGCGYEATLEAWYRFLIEKYPYQSLVRKPCSPGGTPDLCVGPAEDAAGLIQDVALLEERAHFLRPDSLVAIVMLTDENDCSFKASGQSWRLTEVLNQLGDQVVQPLATSVCETNPDDPCCASCAQTTPSMGCGLDPACYANGDTSDPSKYLSYTVDSDLVTEDSPNLRCYKQKKRFGIEYLYPVERYINALTQTYICPGRSDAATTADCNELNPLFDDLSTTDPSKKKPPRPGSLIFLAGIVGVPWQDLAVDPNAATLVYRKSVDLKNPAASIDWNWLLGSNPLATEPVPADPFLHEQVEPRAAGTPNPALPSAQITNDPQINAINGHEWNIARKNDLQYACTFPLPQPQDCNDLAENEGKNIETDHWSNCDCETAMGLGHGGDTEKNPLCQPRTGGAYGSTQYSAKAYPGIRHLQVMYGVGDKAIVASICPKTLEGSDSSSEFGYNPAVAAIVDRLKEQLADPCLPRPLTITTTPDGAEVACKIVEASSGAGHTCDPSRGREDVTDGAVAKAVRDKLRATKRCDQGANSPSCDSLSLCTIKQITEPGLQRQCMTQESFSAADGWCYVDAEQVDKFGLAQADADAALALVEKCSDTEKRKLRFVGDGKPDNGTTTVFACAGATFESD